tara:strand:- start:235 stop:417 length:183 start_codon:yes stop_codon:yes gene_type:complete
VEHHWSNELSKNCLNTAQKLQVEWRGSAIQIVNELQDFEESARKAFPNVFSQAHEKDKDR